MLRFAIIGGSSVAIDGCCYALIVSLSSNSPDIAKAISYVCGMLFGFWGNKLWTFESQRRSMSEPVFYVLIYTVTLGINVGINRAVLSLAGDEFRVVGFFLATGVTTVSNFVGMKFLAFREQTSSVDTPLPVTVDAPETVVATTNRKAA